MKKDIRKGKGKNKVRGKGFAQSKDRRKRVRSNFKKSRSGDDENKFYTKEDIFLSRLASILQVSKGNVRGMLSERVLSTIRLNPLAGDPEKILAKLKSNGWNLVEVPWSPHTFIVKDRDKSELGKSQDYSKGLFYIQNLSSMLPVLVLDPSEKDEILDMCAAPGSKTSMMASLMNNKGKIVANDESYLRARDLKEVLSMFYVKNTTISIADGEALVESHRNAFNKILLDAPCSGEGLIYLQAPKPLRFWSIKKINIMSALQKRLISAAYKMLKPGGTLVYSTCTLEPSENEEVVSHLLHLNPEAKVEQIELVSSELFKDYKPFVKKGIKHWSKTDYNPEVGKSIRVIPGKHMQGFYVAKIVKDKK